MNHIDTLRRIHALAATRNPFSRVDTDIAEEAGMDGNLARLLQAARDLDNAVDTQEEQDTTR